MKAYKQKIISIILFFIAALVIWELAAYILSDVLNDSSAERKLPHLTAIASSYAEGYKTILKQGAVTYVYAGAGFGIGGIVGFILALLMKISRLTEKMILPYLLGMQMIPVLGLAPIIFALFKDIAVSRIVIAAYITFFPVSVNMLSGLKSADEELVMLFHSYGASKVMKYRKLLIPYAIPYMFTGLKISAPMAVTAAILVDTLSSHDGIGYIIVFTLYGGGTVGLFWPAIITAGLMGMLSFFVVAGIETLFVPQNRKEVI